MIQNTNYGTSKTYVDNNIGVWNWSATRTYSSGDIVSYSGILYVSLQNNNTNQIPSSATTYWGVYNKSGSANVGTDTQPIKLVAGVPTAVTDTLAKDSAVVHLTGDETIAGVKTIAEVDSPTTVRTGMKLVTLSTGATEEWYKVYELSHSGANSYGDQALTMMVSYARRSAGDTAYIGAIGTLTVSYRSNYIVMKWIVAGDGINPANFKISRTYDSTANRTNAYIWAKVDSNTNRWVFQKLMASTLNSFTDNWNVSTDTTAYTEPTEAVWGVVVTSTIAPIKGTVTTNTAQTIEGTKTFFNTGFSEIVVKSARTGTDNIGGLGFFNASGARVGQLYGATDGSIIMDTLQTTVNAGIKALHQRAYNASNTTDVVTIGTLKDNVVRVGTADGNSDTSSAVNISYVSQTGDSAPNNLLHKSGDETKYGTLKINSGIMAYPTDWHTTGKTGMIVGNYCIFAEIETNYNGRYLVLDFIQSSNTATAYGRLILRCNRDTPFPLWLFRKSNGSNNPLSSTSVHVISDGSKMYLAWKKEATYGAVSCCEMLDMSYGTVQNYNSSNITWYDEANRIVLNDLSGYTDYAVVE